MSKNTAFCALAGTALGLGTLFLGALSGRRHHPGMAILRSWPYAHRGLHGNGVPENSMAAFRRALEAGYGIELDLHLLSDGTLAVMHDSSLARTTGREGRIEDLTASQLGSYRLEGTEESIPTFRQVLDLFGGKAPMIIELKTCGDNVEPLCRAVCAMLETYPGAYCLESFDPRCIYWLRKHRPEIIRGQLAENFMASQSGAYPPVFLWAMTNDLMNFLTRPDFLAYKFSDRKTLCNALCRRLLGIQGVTWTLRTREEFDTAVKEGWIPIFEGIQP